MKNKLAILGASGHGAVIADLALSCGWKKIDFFDDGWPRITKNTNWSIIGDTEKLIAHISDYNGLVVAVGSNQIRKQLIRKFIDNDITLPKLVHPRACISKFATIGGGSVVMPNVVVNANSSIGCGVILNTACVIEHDCHIADYVHISPGALLAGNVVVQDSAWIGLGAVIRQGSPSKPLVIGENAVVGMGAVVTKDVPPNTTVVGNPARPLVKD